MRPAWGRGSHNGEAWKGWRYSWQRTTRQTREWVELQPTNQPNQLDHCTWWYGCWIISQHHHQHHSSIGLPLSGQCADCFPFCLDCESIFIYRKSSWFLRSIVIIRLIVNLGLTNLSWGLLSKSITLHVSNKRTNQGHRLIVGIRNWIDSNTNSKQQPEQQNTSCRVRSFAVI